MGQDQAALVTLPALDLRKIAAQAWNISDLRPLIPVNTGTLPINHACLAVKPAK